MLTDKAAILTHVLKSIVFGLSCTGLQYAFQDLAKVQASTFRSDGGFLFGTWELEVFLFVLFVRVWSTPPFQIAACLCTPILRWVYPDVTICVVSFMVVHDVLVRIGILGFGPQRDLLLCGLAYNLYKFWRGIKIHVALQFLEDHLTMPLQWGLDKEKMTNVGYLAAHPWSSLLPVLSIAYHTSKSRSDWFLALITYTMMLRSWSSIWLTTMYAVIIFKYMEGGSFMIIDKFSSVVLWIVFFVSLWVTSWLGTKYTTEEQGKDTPSSLVILLSSAVMPFCCFLVIGVWSVASVLSTQKSFRIKLDYFDSKRRAKIFGPNAAFSRESEPFMDRASRINASWYDIYMPATASDGSKCIRLARFIAFGDEIQCEVRAFGLGQTRPPYVALSYTCGDPDPLVSESPSQEELYCIQCNGQAFYTRPNLYDALTALKQMHLESFFWCDTICIDQSSPDERLSQVAWMGQIYHSAHEVLLWTGKSNETLVDALAFFKGEFELIPGQGSVQEKPLDMSWSQKLLVSMSNNPTDLATHHHTSKRVQSLFASIQAFWSRKWVRRAWILQELALARSVKIYCGQTALSWETVKDSMLFLWQPIDTNPPAFVQDLHNIRENLPHFDVTTTKYKIYWMTVGGVYNIESFRATYLLYLISATKRFECSDPRDKIFSVIGMVNMDAPTSTKARELHLVYDTSVEDLCYWTAHYCILACPSLVCLSLVGKRSLGEHYLPSWVPSFHVSDQITPILFNDKIGRGLHQGLLNKGETRIEGPLLHVCGKSVDTIVEVFAMPLGDLLFSDLESLDPVFAFCAKTPPSCLGGYTVAEALWRTLACTPRSSDSKAALKSGDFCNWIESLLYKVFKTRQSKMMDRLGIRDYNQTPREERRKLFENFWLDHMALASISDACTEVMKLPKPDHLFQEQDTNTFIANLLLQSSPMMQKLYPYAQAIKSTCVGRRLFRTQQGYLGMAVDTILPGDSVVAFKASKIPFILRARQEDQSESLQRMFPKAWQWKDKDYDEMSKRRDFRKPKVGVFHVIGEAYLHGFMDGERAAEIASTEEDTICLI